MNKLFLTPFVVFISLLSNSAEAAKISQVKGTKALIDLESDSAYAGDRFFALDENGKKKAIITITQVKGSKAVADVTKGAAKAGMILEFAKATKPQNQDSAQEPTSISIKKRGPRDSWGLTADVIMGNMSASFKGSNSSDTKSTTMVGTNFGLSGYYDYMMSSDWSIRGIGGYQMFNLSGSTTLSDCGGSNTCNVSINYLSGYGLLRYHLTSGTSGAWIGAGGGVLIPAGSSSNVINTKKTSFNFVFSFAGGMDYQVNKKSYVPFAFEYHNFPSSDSVKSSMMILKVGYGWYF